MTDAELKALAEKATPGPWIVSEWTPRGGYTRQCIGTEHVSASVAMSRHLRPEDAAYIAACSPERILALLSRLSRAQARVQRLEAALLRVSFAYLPQAVECKWCDGAAAGRDPKKVEHGKACPVGTALAGDDGGRT